MIFYTSRNVFAINVRQRNFPCSDICLLGRMYCKSKAHVRFSIHNGKEWIENSPYQSLCLNTHYRDASVLFLTICKYHCSWAYGIQVEIYSATIETVKKQRRFWQRFALSWDSTPPAYNNTISNFWQEMLWLVIMLLVLVFLTLSGVWETSMSKKRGLYNMHTFRQGITI